MAARLRGLGARDQVMHVYQDDAHNAGNAYLATGPTPHLSQVAHDSFELCLVTTLDGYLAGQPVDFVKIDVEGMEHAVLAGAAGTLRRWRPTVYYETHLACFDHGDIRRAGAQLEEAGYVLHRVEPDGRFVPVAYPDYGLNTLAIHPSRAPAVSAG